MLPEIQGGTPMQPKKLVVHGEISLRTPALDDIHAGQRPATPRHGSELCRNYLQSQTQGVDGRDHEMHRIASSHQTRLITIKNK